MKTQWSASSCKLDPYFHDYKLAIEDDELGFSDRNIDYKVERKKSIEEKLGFEFIRINPDGQNPNTCKAMNKKYRRIKQYNRQSFNPTRVGIFGD